MANSLPAANWFLGLVVPEEAAREPLLLTLPDGLRPFAASDLHITVAFLGPCGQERAMGAWQAIAALRHPPIAVVTGGWRAMGPALAPSAYALTLEPDPALDRSGDDDPSLDRGRQLVTALIASWRQPALAAAGLPPARRAALPHISLVRPCRRGLERERTGIEAWLQQHTERQAPQPQAPRAQALQLQRSFVLREIALYTWARDRQQQLFRIQARRPLDQGWGGG